MCVCVYDVIIFKIIFMYRYKYFVIDINKKLFY